jgi:hypothetical protein
VQWAQEALNTVSARSAGGGKKRGAMRQSEVEERVSGILNGLARRLERDRRGRARRTVHAERRHRSGERPTRKALDDVRLARPGSILVDERAGTLVILGERGRTHFFTPGGRLVSSVRYSRDAVEKKRKLYFWREATVEESRALQEAVLRSEEADEA